MLHNIVIQWQNPSKWYFWRMFIFIQRKKNYKIVGLFFFFKWKKQEKKEKNKKAGCKAICNFKRLVYMAICDMCTYQPCAAMAGRGGHDALQPNTVSKAWRRALSVALLRMASMSWNHWIFQRMEVGWGGGRSLRKVPGPEERASKAKCLGVISDGDHGPVVDQKMSRTVDQGLANQE